jgi:hypothetical protein
MTLLTFSEYLPLSDLAKILAVAVVVALMAPAAVSLGIVGLDRRHTGHTGVGTTFVVAGVGLLALLVGIGLYALVHK